VFVGSNTCHCCVDICTTCVPVSARTTCSLAVMLATGSLILALTGTSVALCVVRVVRVWWILSAGVVWLVVRNM
jgi:hypothetical protein